MQDKAFYHVSNSIREVIDPDLGSTTGAVLGVPLVMRLQAGDLAL